MKVKGHFRNLDCLYSNNENVNIQLLTTLIFKGTFTRKCLIHGRFFGLRIGYENYVAKLYLIHLVEKVEQTLIDGESIPEKKKDQKKKLSNFDFPVPHAQQLVSFRPTVLEAFIG